VHRRWVVHLSLFIFEFECTSSCCCWRLFSLMKIPLKKARDDANILQRQKAWLVACTCMSRLNCLLVMQLQRAIRSMGVEADLETCQYLHDQMIRGGSSEEGISFEDFASFLLKYDYV